MIWIARQPTLSSTPTPSEDAMPKSKKPVWDKPAPKGASKPLKPAQKAAAKRMAEKAGRPYPNLVDNLRAARKGRSA
jgi:hypothetical protein